MIAGLSVTFRTGCAHALERGAIVQDIAALHLTFTGQSLGSRTTSISQQIAGIRGLLFLEQNKASETGYWFKKASEVRSFGMAAA